MVLRNEMFIYLLVFVLLLCTHRCSALRACNLLPKSCLSIRRSNFYVSMSLSEPIPSAEAASSISLSDMVQDKVRKGAAPEFAIEGDSVEETLTQQVAVASHFLLVLANLIQTVASFQALAPADYIMLPLTVMASIVLGDLGTGVFHWSVDNYGSLKTPIFGAVCVAFQGHHQTPWTITFRSFINNVYKIAFATVPTLVLLLSLPVNPYARLFLSLFINWWLVSQEFHKYSHMKQVPPLIKKLQEFNVILSRKEHGLHHNSPFEGHYCILTGICNDFLDKTKFFRHMEKLVYRLTGNEPITWKQDLSLKELAMSSRIIP